MSKSMSPNDPIVIAPRRDRRPASSSSPLQMLLGLITSPLVPVRGWAWRGGLVTAGVFGCLAAPAAAQRRPAAQPQMPLQVMTYADAERGGAVGTGCTWHGADKSWRMSMADDRAAVKRDGRLVALKPAPGAKEVFPFTYRRWTGGGVDITIRDTEKVVRRGREFVETTASLELTENGRKRSWRGRLSCGS